MKFKDYKYIRPDYKKYKVEFDSLVDEFKRAETFQECDEKFTEIKKMRNTVSTMYCIAYIRYTIDINDKFYSEELTYWDENNPLYEELDNKYFKELLNSKFRKQLEAKYSKQLFKIIDLKLKGFSSEIIEETKLENKLVSEYTNLMASAKITFQDKEVNLSELEKYKESTDREIRKAANLAYSKFFEENEEKFDSIYDKLVKVRDKMAKKLGYKNYTELGYIKRVRTDFNEEMVYVLRKQVKDYIVPIVFKLIEKQRERLNLDVLEYYNEPIEFISGNAMPKGDSKWIIENAMKMYTELSSETKEFFEHMIKNELMDLETRSGKASGGYCEFLLDYNTPFIFGNFNGTSNDINILTHEVGHSFQSYHSQEVANMNEIIFPTYEAAEIHSMSMEFLTWPWMKNFFLDDADKYKFVHLSSALKFIPYAVVVDSFQSYVYNNPDNTPEERRVMWRKLEKEYLPYKNYSGDEFLERGGYWFRQRHIFQSPFYYIDYALAQICAFQFWKKSNEDREECWNDYMNICKVGGTKLFLEIVKLANLKSPFEEGSISSVVTEVENYIDSINF